MNRPPRSHTSWFNPRNVTALVVTLMTLGLVWSVISQWIPPHPRAPQFDSYSGTVIGFRGIYDLLDALGPPVRRNLQPPPAWLSRSERVVFLQPSILALELEKDYLKQVHDWVRAGGEVLLVSDEIGPDAVRNGLPPHDDEQVERLLEFFGEDRLLPGLGIDDLEVAGSARASRLFHRDSEDWGHIMTNLYDEYRRLDTEYRVSASGALAQLEALAPTIDLPGDGLRYFEGTSVKDAVGSLSVAPVRGGETSKPIALEFAVGRGRVTVVAEPALMINIGLAKDANAVLAYHLVAGTGNRPVIIDEYYHGSLAGRSALHVLTLPPFPIIALTILAAVCIWTWSHLVRFGPPQPDDRVNRRSILEYVDAMARLYRRGKKELFILKSLRDGAVERLRQEALLPAGIPEDHMLRRLALRDSDAAHELATLLETIDGMLASGAGVSKQQLAQLQGKLERCRSMNTPPGNRPTPLTTAWGYPTPLAWRISTIARSRKCRRSYSDKPTPSRSVSRRC